MNDREVGEISLVTHSVVYLRAPRRKPSMNMHSGLEPFGVTFVSFRCNHIEMGLKASRKKTDFFRHHRNLDLICD